MKIPLLLRIRWAIYLTVMFLPAILLISFATYSDRETADWMQDDYFRRWKAILTGVKQ